jgi:hypothetical protein
MAAIGRNAPVGKRTSTFAADQASTRHSLDKFIIIRPVVYSLLRRLAASAGHGAPIRRVGGGALAELAMTDAPHPATVSIIITSSMNDPSSSISKCCLTSAGAEA